MCGNTVYNITLNLISQGKLKKDIQENNHSIIKHQDCETSKN